MFHTGHYMPEMGCWMRSLVQFSQPRSQEQPKLPQLVICFLTVPALSSTVSRPRILGLRDEGIVIWIQMPAALLGAWKSWKMLV